jgi:PhzF family phenazine biosynthesis protein
MRKVKVKLFDSFTDQLFGGNIAGVVTRAEDMTNDEMQKIARELAATTGYALQRQNNDFEVRFFTPTQEIDMCGHVVVGVFMGLAEEGRISLAPKGLTEIRQFTKAGIIPVEVHQKAGQANFVMMEQCKPIFKPCHLYAQDIAILLGIGPEGVMTKFPIEIVSTALRHLFIPVQDLKTIAALKPDYLALGDLSRSLNVETICVFTPETMQPGYSVHSRDFCPAIGIPEEAGSGTTSGALSCYLIKHGLIKVSPDDVATVLVEQGYEMGRPSSIRADITLRSAMVEKVKVGGTAVRSLSGEITLP